MDLRYLKNLDTKRLDKLGETLEGAIDIILDEENFTIEDEYNVIKLELILEIIDSLRDKEDFARFTYTIGWEYCYLVPQILENMEISYTITQDSSTMICLIDLKG